MNMITENHNFDAGYIGLVNLEISDLPSKVTILGEELILKSEFHVSLLCLKRLAPLIDADNVEDVSNKIVDLFLRFSSSNQMTSCELTNEFYLVERDERKALVVMVQIPKVKQLFQELSQEFNTDLPVQPTHITLYTLQPEKGIGILTNEELRQEGKKVEVPEMHQIKLKNQH